MRLTVFWDITQRTVVIPNRRFGTNYQSRLQGPMGCHETSVSNRHHMLRNTAEERRSQETFLFTNISRTDVGPHPALAVLSQGVEAPGA